ncbi:MAG: transcription termination factor NusA [Bacilli bacterium]|jgi:N utilization substance protein A|nr:transcription termination factor NusA [Bacilli bacterium]
MARRSNDDDDYKFEGKFDVKKFDAAAEEIEEAHQIPKEQVHELLRQAIDKAARDTLYPNPKTTNAKDMHSETILDEATGEISFFECKDVVEVVEDDLYQIELDDAKDEQHPDIKIGDVWKHQIPFSEMDYSFFTRAIQNFMQKIKEATKQALVDKYSERIGQIITGTVEKVEGGFTTLVINKIPTTLTPQNSIPGEHFAPGDTVKVLLKGIGTTEETGDRATSLLVTRVDDNFLKRLFEQEIPDIADGSVVINGIVREPGNRAKVAVSSPSPDVDPTGACIGSDGSRIKDICAQLANEKIDVIRYQDNPYLYIAEALKPATVVGVVMKDEPIEDGKAPKAVAIVKNAESKIAIGKKGVNVRLASRLTGYSIDIKEQDAAMAEHVSYLNIDDIRRKLALERLDQEEGQVAPEQEEEAIGEENPTEETASQEEVAPTAAEEAKPVAEETVKPVEEKPVETVAPVVEEKKEEAVVAPSAPVVAPTPVVAPSAPVVAPLEAAKPVVEAKKEEKPVEHVEIRTRAKISLDKLEAEIEAEKKNKNKTAAPYRRFHNDKDKSKDKDKDEQKKNLTANAMPIYTEEELKEMESEEQQDNQGNQNAENGDDYSEYDNDQYYQNGK